MRMCKQKLNIKRQIQLFHWNPVWHETRKQNKRLMRSTKLTVINLLTHTLCFCITFNLFLRFSFLFYPNRTVCMLCIMMGSDQKSRLSLEFANNTCEEKCYLYAACMGWTTSWEGQRRATKPSCPPGAPVGAPLTFSWLGIYINLTVALTLCPLQWHKMNV